MREALTFLTPLGRATAPTPRALAWFAPVGLAVGGLVGAVWWGAGELWAPGVAAALAVTADLALTGLLHFDGLADSADGLLPHLPPSRRLEIMREPGLGAFGVGAAGVALLLRWSALASMAPDPLLVGGLWATSRAAMAVVVSTVAYARPTGLASAFVGAQPGPSGPSRAGRQGPGPALAGGAVLGLGGAVAGAGTAGVAALAGVVAGAAAVTALSRRRVGGFTGDVLGASAVVGETVGLLVAAALLGGMG